MSERPSIQKKIAARLAAVQALYLYNSGTDRSVDDIMMDFVTGTIGGEGIVEDAETAKECFIKLPEMDPSLFKTIFKYAVDNQKKIETIAFSSIDTDKWPTERIEPVLMAILTAGISELLLDNKTDRPKIINEYINLAKSFYEQGPEVGLTNVVMDKVAKSAIQN